MKKIISLLALTLCATLIPLRAEAAEKGKNKRSNRMEIPSKPSADGKFVINGHVDPNIPDSCYNIYIADIDKAITASDLVECVPVKDKKFRFETELPSLKRGRIQAIMPGDNLCEAWIDINFIPDFTVDMTVHNGYYDIHNNQEYQFMTNAWLNRESLMAIYGDGDSSALVFQSQADTQAKKLQLVIKSYRELIELIKQEIQEVYNHTNDLNSRIRLVTKLTERMDGVNAKMEAAIDKYAAGIQ